MRCLQRLQFLMLQIFSNNFLESFLFPFSPFTFIPFLLMLLIRLDLSIYLSIPSSFFTFIPFLLMLLIRLDISIPLLFLHFISLLANAVNKFLSVSQSFSCLSFHFLFICISPVYLSISCLSVYLLLIYPFPVYLFISLLSIHLLFIYSSPVHL